LVGTLKVGEEIWMRKITMAQQWAHKARKHQVEKNPHELPNKYRRHVIVFDEKKAT